MASFVPCPRCHRHVRSTETACVFCGVARASQAAALLSVAALALGGCDPKPAEVPSLPAASASAPVSAPSSEPVPSSAAVTPSATAPAATPTAAPTGSGVATQDPRPVMRYGLAPRN